MERDVVSADENTSVADAVKTMISKNVWSVLITSKGLPVGVLTDRDLIRRCIAPGLDQKVTTVGKHMSSPLITIGPDARLGEALSVMTNKQIRRLYVVEGGKVVGRVTQTGLVSTTMGIFRSLADASAVL